jgi:hypothetical protein
MCSLRGPVAVLQAMAYALLAGATAVRPLHRNRDDPGRCLTRLVPSANTSQWEARN